MAARCRDRRAAVDHAVQGRLGALNHRQARRPQQRSRSQCAKAAASSLVRRSRHYGQWGSRKRLADCPRPHHLWRLRCSHRTDDSRCAQDPRPLGGGRSAHAWRGRWEERTTCRLRERVPVFSLSFLVHALLRCADSPGCAQQEYVNTFKRLLPDRESVRGLGDKSSDSEAAAQPKDAQGRLGGSADQSRPAWSTWST